MFDVDKDLKKRKRTLFYHVQANIKYVSFRNYAYTCNFRSLEIRKTIMKPWEYYSEHFPELIIQFHRWLLYRL